MTTEREYGELVPLGDGPMTTVLAGVHTETGTAYALKVLPGRLDRRTRAELEAELARLSALRAHAPVLVPDRLEEFGNGRLALRMELCTQSLPELLASFGPLSVPDTLALGTALAEALAAAHEVGIVHGGVTPGNVLFRASGEPVLADFGLTLRHAFPADPSRTMDFLAPETVRDGSVDERSDLYGLGAILYLALSGHSPHQGAPGEQEGERLLRVLGSPVPPLPRADLPSGLADLVTALLEKEPSARPVDATTVAGRLSTLYAAVAPPDAPVEPPGTPEPVPPGKQNAGRQTAADATTDPPVVEHEPTGEPVDDPEPEFDDFAAPPAPEAEPSVPAPRPRGEPIVVFGPKRSPRWIARPSVLAGAAALAVLGVVTVLLVLNRPDELDVPTAPAPVAAPSTVPTPTRAAVVLELTDPTDRGNFVELSWRSNQPFDFAVIIAGEGEQTRTIFAHRSTSYRVPVDPVRKYCFEIQATDGQQFYVSPSKPIRGATCRR
ncbi:serine/threonine protein kinase [Micromonospora pisi]|nr:protein kinase [Micromonospora pisi]